LYLLLGAVVVILYAKLLLSSPPQYLKPIEQRVEKTTASIRIAELELGSLTLWKAFQQKPHLALLFGCWMLLALGLGVSGLVLNLWVVWQRKLRQLFRYRSQLPHTWSLQELVRLVVLLVLVASLFPFVHISLMAWGSTRLADPHLWSVIAMFVLSGLLVLVVWGFAVTKAMSLSSALGLSWRRGRGAITQGLVGYAAIFPWIVGLLWLLVKTCQLLGVQPPLEPVHELLFMEGQALVVGLTVVLACVVGPVTEEIFFRGVLFTAVRKHASRLVAMLVSGALFAAVHTNLIGFLPILLLGCFLADLYERTGSLWSPIAVHMLHNTLLVGLGLMVKELL